MLDSGHHEFEAVYDEYIRAKEGSRDVEGDLDGKPIAQRTLDPISEELVAGAKVYDLAKHAQRVEWPWALALSPWTGAGMRRSRRNFRLGKFAAFDQ